MNSPQSNKKVLQMMSAFATMRFELKNPGVYQKNRKGKKTPFTRFGKSHPKPISDAKPKQQKQQRQQKLWKPQKQQKHQKQQKEQAAQRWQEQMKESSEQGGFELKFLQKLSEDTMLLGNEYQLDLVKVGGIYDDSIEVQYKWSYEPKSPIASVSIQHKYCFIAVAAATLQIRKYNLKRLHQPSQLLVSTSISPQLHSIRFAKNLGLFLVFINKVEFRRLSIIHEQVEVCTTFTHAFDYGPNFKLYFVPQAIDSSLNLYFYENKVKKDEASKFGLWMQTIEARAKSDTPTMGKLALVYNINVQERKEFRIYNYSKEFCLIKFPYNIIAIKNGYLVDEAFTNFRNEHSFIEYVESTHTLIHYRNGYIDLYNLRLNTAVKPERIVLECVDSLKFQPPEQAEFYRIMSLKAEQYAVFYQKRGICQPQLQYSFSVSYEVDLKRKIDHMYLKDLKIEESEIQGLSDKCREAEKFGMTTQEAFYQLWKRSNKTSVVDYQILLGTQDFQTIQREVQRKLTKHSMSLRELIKIYSESLLMLRQKVFSPECTLQSLIDYSTCHFLLKKFELYRFLLKEEKKEAREHQSRLGSSQEQKHGQEQRERLRVGWESKGQGGEKRDFEHSVQVLSISIKEFKQYSEMQVLQKLVDLISSYLGKKTSMTMKKIKAILSTFKLTFKLHYMDTIDAIIKTCKLRILEILEELPELFPYRYDEGTLGIGLWTPLTQQQRDQYLFLDQLLTLENKHQVQAFSKHIWFQRHRNSSHGVIVVPAAHFQQFIRQQNNEEKVFYRIFYHLYALRTYDQSFKRLIMHIEKHYRLLPSHLNGRFELYIVLYEMFENINREHSLQTFLQCKEFQLFRMFFEREKIEKNGFILKKVMPLYHNMLEQGSQVFNRGIFNYFSADESSVVDLKCILNKLNNEKNEFHITAEKLYEVLIQAIMIKIRIGSKCDTPIEQILVYIENIPFPIHNEAIMTNLEYIQEINYESQILRTIQVDMSLQQVVENPQKVIELMVQHEISRHHLHEIKNYRSFKVHAYKILAEVQCRKSNIYGDQEHKHALKVYITQLMKTVQKIQLCSKLLKDPYLVEEFQIDTALIEEVVITLFHWKLSNIVHEDDKYFLTHRQYLEKLAELLDVGNPIHCFIALSIKYAELLSFEHGFKIQYPIFSTTEGYPTLNDFIETVSCLQAEQLARLNLETVFRTIMSLKKLRSPEATEAQQLLKYQKKLKVQVYEHVIVHLISVKELKAALENTFALLQLENDYPEFNIVFPVLILQELLQELLHTTCLLFIKLASYYYYSPLELVQIVKHFFSKSFSNSQIDAYLIHKIKEKSGQLAVSFGNPIVAKQLARIDPSVDQNRTRINDFAEWSLKRIVDSNELFCKNYPVYIMFRLMCHNPITVSKWIWCKKKGINIKTVRSVLSFMALEKMFDAEEVLLLGRKIFEIIRFKYTHAAFFNEIIRHKETLNLIELNETTTQPNSQDEERVIKMLSDSIQLLLYKLSSLKQDHLHIIQEREKTDFELLIQAPERYHNRPRSRYIFDDKDDGYDRANDFLVIPTHSRQQNHPNKLNRFSDKDSDRSEKPIYSLIVPRRGKIRKNSEYFAGMIDVQPKSSSKEFGNSISQERLRTEGSGKEFREVWNFKEQPLESKIVEDFGDMAQSGVYIALIGPKKFQKDQGGQETQSKAAPEQLPKDYNLQQCYLEIPEKLCYSEISEKQCYPETAEKQCYLEIPEKQSLNWKQSIPAQQTGELSGNSGRSLAFNIKVIEAVRNQAEPVQIAEALLQSPLL